MTVKAPMNTRAVVRLPEFIGMSCVECNRGDAREMRVGSGKFFDLEQCMCGC